MGECGSFNCTQAGSIMLFDNDFGAMIAEVDYDLDPKDADRFIVQRPLGG